MKIYNGNNFLARWQRMWPNADNNTAELEIILDNLCCRVPFKRHLANVLKQKFSFQ